MCDDRATLSTLFNFLHQKKNDHMNTSAVPLQGCSFRTRFFLPTCAARLAPYELTHVRASSGDCAAGWGRKRGAIFESSEALQWRTQPWSCMDAAPGCRLHRRSSINILTAWPGREYFSAGTKSGSSRARAPWSCSPYWRPCREPHGWRIS